MISTRLFVAPLLFVLLRAIPVLAQNTAPSTAPVPSVARSLPFETLEVRGQRWDRGEHVVKNAADWDAAWPPRQYQPPNIKPPLPESDFEKEMVLAVFQGGCNTGGYSIQITEVLDTDHQLEVVVRKRTPPPWGIVTQMCTHPHHLVKLARCNKPVCFRIEKIKHPQLSRHRLSDGPIDPDVYKEFGYSTDGKARVIVILKTPNLDPVLTNIGTTELNETLRFTSGFAGRITPLGLEWLAKDPNLIGVGFEGPFSLPEEWIVEQDCVEPLKSAGE